MHEAESVREETQDRNHQDFVRFNGLRVQDLLEGFRENVEQDEADQDPVEQA